MRRRELGSASVIMATIVVPAVLLLFTLAHDIPRYYFVQSALQQSCDSAVLEAHSFLPNVGLATKRAEASLRNSLGELPVSVSVRIVQDALYLSGEVSYHPTLGSLMLGAFPGIPLRCFSSSRKTPVDAFVAMDRSSYLAPVPGHSWNTNLPVGALFNTSFPGPIAGSFVSASAHTQRCFTDRSLAVKRAALELYDALWTTETHLVGLGLYPVAPFDKTTSGDLALLTEPSRREIMSSPALSDFGPFTKDRWCGAMVQEEPLGSPYRVPAESRYGSFGHYFFPPSFQFSTVKTGGLSLRDRLWMASLAEYKTPEMDQVLEAGVEALVGVGDLENRGGLLGVSRQHLFLVSGDFPYIGGKRFPDPSVKLALSRKVREIIGRYSLLKRGGSPLVVTYLFPRGSLDSSSPGSLVEELSRFFTGLQANQKFLQFRVLHEGVESDRDLLRRLLLYDGRVGMLSQ
jgi:hypothetical protein